MDKKEFMQSLSSKDRGAMFVVTYGYEGVVTTSSTEEVAEESIREFFAQRTSEELDSAHLTRELTEDPDFLQGILGITKVLAGQDAAEAYFKAFDYDPHQAQKILTANQGAII